MSESIACGSGSTATINYHVGINNDLLETCPDCKGKKVVLSSTTEELLQRLQERFGCVTEDATPENIISTLIAEEARYGSGHLYLKRKTVFEPCPRCEGRGQIVTAKGREVIRLLDFTGDLKGVCECLRSSFSSSQG
jgi:hypothetical protein